MENKEDVIVPAYMKNKDDKNGTAKNKKEKKKIKLNKKFYILLASIIASISLIIGIIFLVRVIKYSKFDEYSKQMDNYGLSNLYNNEKSTSFDKVTRTEAIKLIIGTFSNVGDLSKYSPVEDTYTNEYWVKYAIEEGLFTAEELNKKNASDKITYIEFIEYISRAQVKILGKELDTSVYPNFSDISNITSEQLYALSDLIAKDIIENNNSKIHPNKDIYKGEANKLILNVIKHFNLLLPEGKRYNVNEDKVPSNSSEYPYTLFDVEKSVYEKQFIKVSEEDFKNPIEVYPTVRTTIVDIVSNVENYYNMVLNVDYETINKDSFISILEEAALFSVEDYTVEDYIEYIKSNKIKLKGNAITQLPILYYDGEDYRLRTKIEFEILSSDTKENILYFDSENENSTIVYEANKYSFFIDTIIDPSTSGGSLMYVYESDIYSQKIDENIENISLVKKEEEDIILI